MHYFSFGKYIYQMHHKKEEKKKKKVKGNHPIALLNKYYIIPCFSISCNFDTYIVNYTYKKTCKQA